MCTYIFLCLKKVTMGSRKPLCSKCLSCTEILCWLSDLNATMKCKNDDHMKYFLAIAKVEVISWWTQVQIPQVPSTILCYPEAPIKMSSFRQLSKNVVTELSECIISMHYIVTKYNVTSPEDIIRYTYIWRFSHTFF